MPTTHKIFDGGNASNLTTNQMYPSGTSPAACNPYYSYADHQRERSYGVTKRLDLRASVPYGGGGKDQSLICYFKDNAVAVGDSLATHLLIPNSILFGVSLGIVSPLPGLSFAVKVKEANTTVFASVDAGTVRANAKGCPLATWAALPNGGLFIDEEDMLVLELTALPTDGILPSCGGGGLQLWVTAHVLDLDHGNA